MRTLAEVRPPHTAGALSARLDVDNGYVSRVLQALVDDRLIEREPRRPVTDVSWEALLRQIVWSYSLFDSNETSTWVASSGPERLAKLGRLLPTRTGANVVLAQPFDPIVFDRPRMDGNYPRVSVTQTAIDLLTGNARMPEEGEALLGWMKRNESAWRSDALSE